MPETRRAQLDDVRALLDMAYNCNIVMLALKTTEHLDKLAEYKAQLTVLENQLEMVLCLAATIASRSISSDVRQLLSNDADLRQLVQETLACFRSGSADMQRQLNELDAKWGVLANRVDEAVVSGQETCSAMRHLGRILSKICSRLERVEHDQRQYFLGLEAEHREELQKQRSNLHNNKIAGVQVSTFDSPLLAALTCSRSQLGLGTRLICCVHLTPQLLITPALHETHGFCLRAVSRTFGFGVWVWRICGCWKGPGKGRPASQQQCC